MPAFNDDVWELYDTNVDWTPDARPRRREPGKARRAATAVARSRPTSTTCCRSTTAGWSGSTLTWPAGPCLSGATPRLLFGGMGRLSETSVVNIKNKSHAVTAEIDVPEGGAEGVIVAQGGAFAGWSLYLKDGCPSTPTTCSALNASRRGDRSRGPARHPPGAHGVRLRRRRPRQGRHGQALHRRQAVGEGRVDGDRADGVLRRRDQPMSAATPASPVSEDYTAEEASSPAPSTGCRSTSETTPRTPTTTSPSRSGSVSPWQGSERPRREHPWNQRWLYERESQMWRGA